MRILMAIQELASRRGTQIMVRNVARRLREIGHEVAVFTLETGPIGREISAFGIPILTDLSKVAQSPDVIHAHHNTPAAITTVRFPDVPALFVCDNWLAWHDAPPRLPTIVTYVAVGRQFRDRLIHDHGIPEERVAIHYNAVDLDRIRRRASLPERPCHIVAFTRTPLVADIVARAAETVGIRHTLLGRNVGREAVRPEDVTTEADIVIGTGLGALEGLATGCAVICADEWGSGGLVTDTNFDEMRHHNFACRTRPLSVAMLVRDLQSYDAAAAAQVSSRAREECNLHVHVDGLLRLYDEAMSRFRRIRRKRQDTVALARHLQQWLPNLSTEWPWQAERARLLDEIERLQGAVVRLSAERICRPGEPIHFTATGAGRRYADAGWGVPENWGTWTEGSIARLTLSVLDPIDGPLTLSVFAGAFARPELAVGVSVNGCPLAVWTFREGEPMVERRCTLPADRVGADGLLRILFTIDRPRSPFEEGMGDDHRRLGLGLVWLRINPEKEINP